MKKKIFKSLTIAMALCHGYLTAVVIPSTLFNCCPDICVDFNTLTAGDTTATINAKLPGITFSTTNPQGLVVFNSTNPTCNQYALGSPNKVTNPAGNGIGSGGATGPCINNTFLGNVLVMASAACLPNPGAISGAGFITVEFDCPVILDQVCALNVCDNASFIEMRDSNNAVLKTQSFVACGTNGYQALAPNQGSVKTLRVFFNGMAAVSCICFRCEVVDQAARSCCDTLSSLVNGLITCCDQNTSVINTLETRVSRLETCCDESIVCCSLIEREIVKLLSQVDTQETRIENLQTCCDQNTTAIEALETCCDSNTSRIARLETCCDTTQSRLDRLEFPHCCAFCLDFNLVNLQPGDTQTVINSKLPGIQITATGFNGGGAMIYDSSNPTGINHADLGTPNDKHAGPGQEENNFDTNNVARGNVLIINDNALPLKQSADLRGGSITFTFECAVMVDSLGILDIESEDQPAFITLYDSNNLVIAVIPIPTLHDNGFQRVAINTANVQKIVVTYQGQAAITDLCFHCEVVDIAARSCCEFLSSIVDNFGTRIESLESCCDENRACCSLVEIEINKLISDVDNHETRIENLESCCDEVRSRLDQLEKIDCCPKCFCIDFEQFNPGDTVATINTKVGPFITFSSSSVSPDAGPLIVFDSANPSCGQTALGSPNEDFGGPGIGVGGGNVPPTNPGKNDQNLGNILVISDAGSECWPKAASLNGLDGIITVSFKCPVILCEAGFLNICSGDECPENFVELLDATGAVIITIPLSNLGANSFQKITPNQSGVSAMVVHISGPTALTNVCFRCEVVDEAARSCCDTISSIVGTFETRIEALESCCDENRACCSLVEQEINKLISCCDNHETRIVALESCCDENRICCSILETIINNVMSAQEAMTGSLTALEVVNFSCCTQFCMNFPNLKNCDTNSAIAAKIGGISFTGVPNTGSVVDGEFTCFDTPITTTDGLIILNNVFTLAGTYTGNVLYIKDPTVQVTTNCANAVTPCGGVIISEFDCPVILQSVGLVRTVGSSEITILIYDSSLTVIASLTPTISPGFNSVSANFKDVARVDVIIPENSTVGLAELCFECLIVDKEARSCCDNHETRIVALESCCDENKTDIVTLFSLIDSVQSCSTCVATGIEQLQSCCDNHETRIEALESCCDMANSRLDGLDRCCSMIESPALGGIGEVVFTPGNMLNKSSTNPNFSINVYGAGSTFAGWKQSPSTPSPDLVSMQFEIPADVDFSRSIAVDLHFFTVAAGGTVPSAVNYRLRTQFASNAEECGLLPGGSGFDNTVFCGNIIINEPNPAGSPTNGNLIHYRTTFTFTTTVALPKDRCYLLFDRASTGTSIEYNKDVYLESVSFRYNRQNPF